jgi:hypothetical protein
MTDKDDTIGFLEGELAFYKAYVPSSRVDFVYEGDECLECSASGYQTYSDTSTWRRGGVAGQTFTNDVCDKCWGSGSKSKPWPSHKR